VTVDSPMITLASVIDCSARKIRHVGDLYPPASRVFWRRRQSLQVCHLRWISSWIHLSRSRGCPCHITRRWFHIVLLTVRWLPFSLQVVSPSAVHTFGNCSCCHHNDFVVTRRYPCPFTVFGIGSWKRKCCPTVA